MARSRGVRTGKAAVATLIVWLPLAAGADTGIQGLPFHPSAVSADGSVVVGSLDWRAHRWEAGASTELELPPGCESYPYEFATAEGVSGDGSVIAGRVSCFGSERFIDNPVVWSPDGVTVLPTPPGFSNCVEVGRPIVSDLGSVYVHCIPESGHYWDARLFRWRDGVLEDSGLDLPARIESVSPDESSFVGSSDGSAFQWRDGVFHRLLDPTDQSDVWFVTAARDQSASGDRIAGWSQPNKGHYGSGDPEATLWAEGAPRRLGWLPGCEASMALAISPDGLIVAGKT